MDMEVGESATRYWNEWQAILIDIFDGRLSAILQKGRQAASIRKKFSAILLQVKGFELSGVNLLPEAIKLITGREVNQPGYDPLAMLGHRYGIVENINELSQYLRDVQEMLRPEGQVLLTSIDTGTIIRQTNRPIRENSTRFRSAKDIQFQNGKLIGPFFNTSCFKVENLKTQALAANWQSQTVYFQDEYNYLVLLSIP